MSKTDQDGFANEQQMTFGPKTQSVTLLDTSGCISCTSLAKRPSPQRSDRANGERSAAIFHRAPANTDWVSNRAALSNQIEADRLCTPVCSLGRAPGSLITAYLRNLSLFGVSARKAPQPHVVKMTAAMIGPDLSLLQVL